MLIMAFESSAKAASVALCRNGRLIGQYYQNNGLTHSRTLLPMGENLLRSNELYASDIDLFAVSQGPGSFTGVRIGVSTVKGLAWASNTPVCGVSALEAMAWQVRDIALGNTLICAVMDARRSQVYNALFTAGDAVPMRLCDDRAVSLEDLAAHLTALSSKYTAPCLLVGDGAALCRDYLTKLNIPCRLPPEPLLNQTAWGVALAAVSKDAVAAKELMPVYLRLPQAEREYNARQQTIKSSGSNTQDTSNKDKETL